MSNHGRRRSGSAYAQVTNAVQPIMTRTQMTPPTGWSKLSARTMLSATAFRSKHDAQHPQGTEQPVLDGEGGPDPGGPARVDPGPADLGQDAFFCSPDLGFGAFLLEPLGLLLGPGRVHVDVLLAGQPHDLVHDLVGDRPQDVAVVLQALVAREVQRLAEAHTGPGECRTSSRAARRRRCQIIATGITGHPGLQRHPRDAGLAAVEPAVVRAGALGVDAEQLTLVAGSARPVWIASSAAEALDRSIGT